MKIIFPPIMTELNNLFIETKNEFTIISPWIGKGVLDILQAENMNQDLKFRVLTVAENIFNGSTDFSAIKQFLGMKSKVHVTQKNLHAKIYIADRKSAIITSANFTENGMIKNFEIGSWVSGSELKKLVEKTDELFMNTDPISNSWIDDNLYMIMQERNKIEDNKKIVIPEDLMGKRIEVDYPDISVNLSGIQSNIECPENNSDEPLERQIINYNESINDPDKPLLYKVEQKIDSNSFPFTLKMSDFHCPQNLQGNTNDYDDRTQNGKYFPSLSECNNREFLEKSGLKWRGILFLQGVVKIDITSEKIEGISKMYGKDVHFRIEGKNLDANKVIQKRYEKNNSSWGKRDEYIKNIISEMNFKTEMPLYSKLIIAGWAGRKYFMIKNKSNLWKSPFSGDKNRRINLSYGFYPVPEH